MFTFPPPSLDLGESIIPSPPKDADQSSTSSPPKQIHKPPPPTQIATGVDGSPRLAPITNMARHLSVRKMFFFFFGWVFASHSNIVVEKLRAALRHFDLKTFGR
jgi:hypothetical protein